MPTYVPTKIPFYPDAAIQVSASDDRADMFYPGKWLAYVGDGTPRGRSWCYGATAEEAVAKLKARMRPEAGSS